MKKLRILCLVCLTAILACSRKEGQEFSAPAHLQIKELTETSVTIQWEKVEQATNYRWSMDTDGFTAGGTVAKNELSVDILTPGTTYVFIVCSEDMNTMLPAKGGKVPLRSEWSKLVFTTPGEDVNTQ